MRKSVILLVLLASTFLVTAQTGKCTSGDCENGYGTYDWYSGKTYTGNWKNGKQNGMCKYDFIVDIVAMEYILTKQVLKITRYCLTHKNTKEIG